ncbi:hypothetical protein [Sulfuricurvum sp.]
MRSIAVAAPRLPLFDSLPQSPEHPLEQPIRLVQYPFAGMQGSFNRQHS